MKNCQNAPSYSDQHYEAMNHQTNSCPPPQVLRGIDSHGCPATSVAPPTPTTCILNNEASSATETILQMDESEPPAEIPPTHLALVLKRRRLGLDGLEEEPEETYAFVDLKYFQPLSANQYVMKSQVIEPSAMLNFSGAGHASSIHHSTPLVSHCQTILPTAAACGTGSIPGGGGGGNSGYYLESGDCTTAIQSPAATYFESFPQQTTVTSTVSTPPPPSLSHIGFATTSSTVRIPAAAAATVSNNCVISPASPDTSPHRCVLPTFCPVKLCYKF